MSFSDRRRDGSEGRGVMESTFHEGLLVRSFCTHVCVYTQAIAFGWKPGLIRLSADNSYIYVGRPADRQTDRQTEKSRDHDLVSEVQQRTQPEHSAIKSVRIIGVKVIDTRLHQ